jgi:flagellin
MINTLEDGAADLVNANMEEESANMLMLQTRQSLGISSLSMASQASQSILRLF